MNHSRQSLLSLLFVFLSLVTFAQTEEKKPAKEAVKVIKPFDISHISEAVELTDKLIRASNGIAQDSAGEADLVVELDAVINSFNPDKLDSIEVDYSELNLWALKDKSNYWEDEKQKLTKQSEKIKVYVDKVRGSYDTIKYLENRWLITKAVVDTLSDVESITATVLSSIERAKVTSERLKEKISRTLELENRTSQQILAINDVLAHISSHTEERGKNLFNRDSEPFFVAFKYRSKDDQSFISASYASVKLAADEVKLFLKEQWFSVLYHLLVSLVLFFLMNFVNKRFKRSEFYNEDDFVVAKKLLNRPLLTTILLSLLMSSLFYGRLPGLVRDVLIVIAIIPISVLLPIILNVKMKFFVFFLFLLVFLDKMQGMMPSGGINQRTVVMVASSIALAGFVLMVRTKSQLSKALIQTGNLFFKRLMQAFLPLVIASIVANLLGAFGLARLLSSGVILSFILAIIVFLAVAIIKVLVLYVLRSSISWNINILKNYDKEAKKWTNILLNVWGVWLWFKATLRGFAVMSFAEERLDQFVETSWQFGEINLSVSNIVNFLFILALFILIANVVNLVLREEVLSRFDMRKGITLAISILSRYVILLLGFILAMSSAGISLSKLSILIGALGVGIGFGLQNIVSNFVSGLVIIFERPIHIGDIITAGLLEGEVIEIGLRSSRIRTWEGAEVIVPNNNLTANDVTNWTFSDKKRRKEIIILVEDGPNPRDVKSIIDHVVQAHDGLLKDPLPQAYFLGYENKALKFRLLIWLSENLLLTPSEVLLNLHDALLANGYKPYIPVQRVLVSKEGKSGPSESIIGEMENDDLDDEQVKDGND